MKLSKNKELYIENPLGNVTVGAAALIKVNGKQTTRSNWANHNIVCISFLKNLLQCHKDDSDGRLQSCVIMFLSQCVCQLI